MLDIWNDCFLMGLLVILESSLQKWLLHDSMHFPLFERDVASTKERPNGSLSQELEQSVIIPPQEKRKLCGIVASNNEPAVVCTVAHSLQSDISPGPRARVRLSLSILGQRRTVC